MCGIAGQLLRERKAELADIRSMCDQIRYRGPDDEGYHLDNACGLGMRRLSIIDLSTGHQPISNEAATIAKLEGFPPQAEAFNLYRSMLTKPGSVIRASTLRDIENGAANEGDHIVGDLLARAKRHGFPAPMLQIADFHLKCYEARRAHETI